MVRAALALVALALASQLATAQIALHVDASEVARKVLRIDEVIPAKPGALSLHYPKWIPGRHRPVGQIANVTEFRISANGKPLAWKRDDADPFTVHLTVPEGAKEVELTFHLLLAAGSEGGAQFMTVASPMMMTMNWNDVLWYPKCDKPLALEFKPFIKLPRGWKHGTALSVLQASASSAAFEAVSLETLIDSPVVAGEHVRVVPLDGEKGAHRVVMACDSADGLEVPEATVAAWKKLPTEAAALFGPARPYRGYTFLLGLSNHIPGAGIEHHESSDNRDVVAQAQ